VSTDDDESTEGRPDKEATRPRGRSGSATPRDGARRSSDGDAARGRGGRPASAGRGDGKGGRSTDGRRGAASDRAGGRDAYDGRGQQRDARNREERPPYRVARRGWGGVADRGARRAANNRDSDGGEYDRGPVPAPEAQEKWVDEGRIRSNAEKAVSRGGGTRSSTNRKRNRGVPAIDVSEANFGAAVGPQRAKRLEARLKEAAGAFARERFLEARPVLAALAEEAPGSALVRELYGLTLYRLERWSEAAAELEAFVRLTGSTEQHPVLADCSRALARWSRVEELWEELRHASPGADLVVEGRIVMAGAFADRGRLPEAIALLDRPKLIPKNAQMHHLRQAYVLADLRERSGDVSRARELFERIEGVDREFADIGHRLRALG